ncbi:hypothetical protein [Arthrobacter bussei]|uniref:HNH endonuclease n=1 Tax=Arthrobacter bussei TaxID=2594179 RepID=A0A7X1NSP2_9MICC|nr:hypothetical protein [Arthrobacter bussei]MPY12314.1 hypothetical protein [Arthrobacter bussei]
MTDGNRAAFSNLMLLCTTHHKLIDGPHRDRYPIELLHQWKTERESDPGALSATNLTDDTLEEVLESLMARFGPIREVVVELEAMLWVAGSILKSPFDSMGILLTHNAHHRGRERGAVVTIRNTGTADVSVEDVSLIYHLEPPTPEIKGAEFTLMGRNDYLHLQSVPHRLLSGDAFQWLTKAVTLAECEAAAAGVGKQYHSLIARVRLATGETIESPEIPWSSVSGLLTTHQDDN